MDRRGGSTLAALLMGAGLLWHTSGGHAPTPKPPSEVPAANLKTASNEGPWLASCQYWSSRRQEPATPASAPASRIAEKVDSDGEDLDWHLVVKAAVSSECASASAADWGVPEDLQHENVRLEAHSVIATVPDPVHSHLALEFDRIMDALIASASDNGYSLSYSWLPWKAPRSATSPEDESRQTSEEPGLLIFDERPSAGRSHGVLYMFVVAEMPADELNADQLKKALSYELQLRSVLGPQFATDEGGNLRVIGPLYSGSAMSLIETLNTILRNELSKPEVVKTATIAGATETQEAYQILNPCTDANGRPCLPIHYLSFASSKEVNGLLTLFKSNGYKSVHAVVLHEDGTIFGVGGLKEETQTGNAKGSHVRVNSIPFPRDFSLLRNSQKPDQRNSEPEAINTPSPYLPLTTRDEGSQDTLPHFSTDITPLSQEAQVMAISHTLTQLHADFAYIAASNPMDTLFLAKWLRRSNPDTRLVMEPDLLLEREGEDTAYIGTLSVSPYPLVWLAHSAERQAELRSFASAAMQAYYNAASYTLGQINRRSSPPILYGYGTNKSDGPSCPKLWLTAVGSDGYYPVAMLTTASDVAEEPQRKYAPTIMIYPSHVWQALCVLLAIAALLHIAALCSASYASPLTCDLDIRENTMPHRRGLYGQVGGAALFLMSVVAAFPVTTFLNSPRTHIHLDRQNLWLGIVTFSLGTLSWLIAITKTFRATRLESRDAPSLFAWSETKLCAALYWNSIAASLALAAMWVRLCTRSLGPQQLGAFFSYRCLHPTSGVSPLAPALLVLFGWLFWAIMHARRLRLTMDSRPVMPDAAALDRQDCPTYKREQPDMFVSDTRLQVGLLEDTTCLMISRRFLHQIFRVPIAVRGAKDRGVPNGIRSGTAWKSTLVDILLMLFLAALAALWIGLCPMRAIDHFGQAIGPTTLYELFMGLLLVPLLVIVLCAAARLFLMSASLRAHLLEPLERMPLRQAFTRLKGFHWVSMLRESGQLERWRDMSRSTEGIRQILNDPEMPTDCTSGDLGQQKTQLEEEIARLQQHVKTLRDAARPDTRKRAWEYMAAIEKMYATCSETVLCCILLPHWLQKRHNLMQSVSKDAAPEKEPNVVLLAEELLAIRYVAIIRAVLAQMRYLLLFITVALVLIMLATNSYPFQPKQEIDWCVTGLFLSFSAGIVLVMAQMHRNALLSRITNKNSKSLGLDFYLRVAGFGAVPLLTWLATQYPSIGGTLYGLLRPGLEVMK